MKDIKDLTFADDFMFGWIIRHDAELCRELLECLMGMKIKRIEYMETQKEEDVSYFSKAVCFDVYADDGRVFDIEMQTASNPALLKRARYYQAMMDTGQLETGRNYVTLKDTYIIFICTFDPFGEKQAVYDVRRVFAHNMATIADNGAHELYFNAKGYKTAKNVDLSAFLRYIIDGKVATPLTQKIENAVVEERHREENMFTIKDAIIMENEVKGYLQGMQQVKTQTAEAMLADKMDAALVSRYTNLPLEEVKRMAATL